MANNIDLTICALECPLGTFQCSGRLIFRKEYTVLFSPKRTTSRFASLTLRTPHRSPVSLCFSGRLIFRLRTEPALRAAPVFRMAYSAPTAHCAVSSETLMLQVRFAHPPNPAPSSRFFVLFSKTHDLQVRFALPPNPAPSSRLFVLFWSAFFPSPHRISSSSCSGVPVGLFSEKSTPYSFLQNARPSGSLRSPSEPHTALPFLLH